MIAVPAGSRNPGPILFVTGMASERRLAAGPATTAIGSGGLPRRLRSELDGLSGDFSAVVSFGIAGGLQPGLRPGQVVVASAIVSEHGHWQSHADFAERLRDRLSAGIPTLAAELAGSDEPVSATAAKHALHTATGAAAVDMESHIGAAFAAKRDIPFAAIRVVCDPAERSLPALAATAILPSGRINYRAMMASVLREPGQLAAMPRLAGDAAMAFRALRRCRDLLGIGRRFPDLRELLRDVA